MKWKVFELTTRTDAVDMISAVLGDLGVQGIEIEDNVPLTEAETKGMFIDILPELPPDDGTAKVRFYLDDADDEAAILAGLRQELEDMKSYMDLGACTLTTGETEDKDWINNWKEFFHPFTVDEFLIKPTWEDVPEKWADKRVIEMDPGTAFGTGQHETTQLCIRALKRHVQKGDHVFDIGTGSGILGIVALLLGAEHVVGTDVDENACVAAEENRAVNGIAAEAFPIFAGDVIGDEAFREKIGANRCDLVVANILADIIMPLLPVAKEFVAPGGRILTSGILNTREAEVRAAAEKVPGLRFVEKDAQNDWVCLVFEREA